MKRALIFPLLAILLLSACRAKKKRTISVVKTITMDTSKLILPEIKSVLNNIYEFDYLRYKANCDYKDSNMDQSFTMNIRMKRDSILWISITAVGF